MAFDEGLAVRIRDYFGDRSDLREVRMMGALCFMLRDHMCCGVTGENLMVRVGPDKQEAALKEPHVLPFEVGGNRAPQGFIMVEPEGVGEDDALAAWLERGVETALSLPAKKPAKPRKAR